MKTGVLISALVLGVGITGVVLTKNGYEEVADRQLNQWLTDVAPGSRIERQTKKDFLVHFEDTFTVTLSGPDQQRLGLPTGSDEPLTITLQNACTALPFLLRCSDTIDFSGSDSLQELAAMLEDYDYQLGWGFNLITRSVSAWFDGDAYSTSATDHPFNLGELAVKTTTDMAFSTLYVDMTISEIHIPSDAMTVTLTHAAVSADLDDIQKNSWIGTNTFSLDSLIIATGDSSELITSDIFINSETTEYAKDQYDLSYLVRIDSLSMNQPGIVAEASDIKFDMRLYGITARALDLLQQLQQAAVPYLTIEQELFDEMGKNETGLNVNALAVTLNGADLSTQGSLTLSPFTYNDFKSGSLARKAHGKFTTFLSGDLDTAAPQLLPALQQYEQMGIVNRDEKGDYQSEVSLQDGKLTVNGKLFGEF